MKGGEDYEFYTPGDDEGGGLPENHIWHDVRRAGSRLRTYAGFLGRSVVGLTTLSAYIFAWGAVPAEIPHLGTTASDLANLLLLLGVVPTVYEADKAFFTHPDGSTRHTFAVSIAALLIGVGIGFALTDPSGTTSAAEGLTAASSSSVEAAREVVGA